MGLQLIFVVETNKKTNSDWIYIKETINHFYKYNEVNVRLTPVYMDGKGKYRLKEKEIKSLINQYASTSKSNETKVLYCFDCDDYDVKQEDANFIKDAQLYCINKGYQFVWFCKDIERVFLKRKVEDNKKKQEAVKFKTNSLIKSVDEEALVLERFKTNTSNIMNVLDQYLTRKEV